MIRSRTLCRLSSLQVTETMPSMVWICALLKLLFVHNVVSFNPVPSRRSRNSSKLSMIATDDEEQRMALVRSLQSAYYQSPSTEPTVLEKNTGIMRNLPLWRVQWTELPGRSNVLNVHEGTYTNMFEAIIRGPKPWYVGHLYLPGGSKNIKSSEKRFQLKTWEREANDNDRSTQEERSAVVGTLMRISDYRRMADGRLMLLVQALERFVVVDCIQTLPYSIANVQILPDFDEASLVEREEAAQKRRANAVMASFQFHDYEYDPEFQLRLSESKYLSATDIWGPSISRVLPFVPYSKSSLDMSKLQPAAECVESKENEDIVSLDEASLELRLVDGGILSSPAFLSDRGAGLSADQLEDRLWVSLRDFCRASQITVPSEVSCLLPPDHSWNDAPALYRVSPDYPSKRRQRRLSFSASAFLEQTKIGADLRQAYLGTPGTKDRLRMVLERFEYTNDIFYGRVQKE